MFLESKLHLVNVLTLLLNKLKIARNPNAQVKWRVRAFSIMGGIFVIDDVEEAKITTPIALEIDEMAYFMRFLLTKIGCDVSGGETV